MDTGRIQLAAAIHPPLESGSYQVHVSQSTNLPDCNIADAYYDFQCEADALALRPDEIYSVYPPKDSFGRFDLVLSHIVLKRRTLPWERAVSGDTKIPWTALLLFDETEGCVLRNVTQWEAFRHVPGTIYCPVKKTEKPDEMCMALDVPRELFCAVCPEYEDLPFMAHARRVCRDNKPTEPVVIDEWLSVLIGNRTPRSAVGEEGVKNTAYVVSLEDFGDFLKKPGVRQQVAANQKYQWVRIPVLTSWSFHSRQDDFDFKTVFSGLDVDTFLVKQAKNKSLPSPAKALVSNGYIPMDHVLRDGGNTVSWYRGPFVPYDKPFADNAAPKRFSDTRLIYDPALGMFDVSYGAAFQLGRMLGMRSGSFYASLDAWRRQNQRQASDGLTRAKVLEHVSGQWQTAASSSNAASALQETLEQLTWDLLKGDDEA